MTRRFLKSTVALTTLVVALNAFADLRLERTLWGLDGKVQPEAFNPVSVLVQNPTPEPFDGTLTLRRSTHGKRTGARLVRPVYLGPHAAKWVQFHPFVFDSSETWILSWKGCRELHELRPRQSGPPATVFLIPNDALFKKTRLTTLPEVLFPASVALTSGLHAVVLDHPTSLSPAQKIALIDWIKAGGILHVLRNGDGVWPTFTGSLSLLNDVAERSRLGDGLVVRHEANAKTVDAAYLAKRGFPAPMILPRDESPLVYEDFTEARFRKLKSLVKTDHNWFLIYFLVVVYLILIGPVNYLLGRKTLNYKRPILFFLGVVLGFSLLFSYIGRRGYGESTIVHDLSLACPLGNGDYDVRQWLNAFVTSGDYYKITHPGDHHYYSTCQRYEAVNGVAVNGRDGFFHVDIPLFSSRPLYHRGKMTGPDFTLTVQEEDFSSKPPKMTVKVEGDFPETTRLIRLIKNNRIYSMKRQGDVLTLSPGYDKTLDEYLRNWRQTNPGHGMFGASISPDVAYDSMIPPLMVKGLGGHSLLGERLVRTFPGRSKATLFVLTDTPSDFHIASDAFGKHEGRVLYQIPLRDDSERNQSLR